MPETEEERLRSIRFPQELWDLIDEDAVRWHRSSVKQMEAVLSTYYGLGNAAVDVEHLVRLLDRLRELRSSIDDVDPFPNASKEKKPEPAPGDRTLKHGVPLAPHSKQKIPLARSQGRRKSKTG